MNEAFDEWKAGKVPQGYNVYFDEWAERDLAEFVQRDRNHPSVVLWSAGNEIPEQVRPDGHLVLKRLQDIIHREDPSRLVTTGNDRIRAGNGPARLEFSRRSTSSATTTWTGGTSGASAMQRTIGTRTRTGR